MNGGHNWDYFREHIAEVFFVFDNFLSVNTPGGKRDG